MAVVSYVTVVVELEVWLCGEDENCASKAVKYVKSDEGRRYMSTPMKWLHSCQNAPFGVVL